MSVAEHVAGLRASELKQLSGRAAFRHLMHHHRHIVELTALEMHLLARETAAADLPVTLKFFSERLRSGATRQRLFWHIHGDARIAPFERVRSYFPKVPAPLHPYIEQCHIRAQELNAIEAIFRYAACQIETYLKHGTVKLGGGAPARHRGGRQAVAAK
ncbi:hypothetical protein [Paraburkholderia sp. HD33-4]|uniref:hypothetical protein n=1 Tax=Paraburkholderia sp. HD33-4 TaxID=2883242 RepID=UPI001F35744E|nr:hypothetical protein [Paraburkholderia sp. HD33-4]